MGSAFVKRFFWSKGGPIRKNFTAEQILHTVRLAESGIPVAEACRKIGITEQTFIRGTLQLYGEEVARS